MALLAHGPAKVDDVDCRFLARHRFSQLQFLALSARVVRCDGYVMVCQLVCDSKTDSDSDKRRAEQRLAFEKSDGEGGYKDCGDDAANAMQPVRQSRELGLSRTRTHVAR